MQYEFLFRAMGMGMVSADICVILSLFDALMKTIIVAVASIKECR